MISKTFSNTRLISFVVMISCIIAAACFYSPETKAATRVDGVRVWKAPDHTRLVFDLSKTVSHHVFTLNNPHRVVIDLKKSSANKDLINVSLASTPLTKMRVAKQKDGTLRIVLDTSRAMRPKSFVLAPNKKYGHRLVLDLFDKNSQTIKTEQNIYKSSRSKGSNNRYRDVIVAIDAGHGGEDPGAIGRNGTKEKDIVLQIARELASQLRREKGIRPVLVRNGDYYLKLDKRRHIASDKYNADMFISIHADSFTNSKARGASVFTLSNKGATSGLARYLAEKENQADLIGGVRISTNNKQVRKVVMDLAMDGVREHSFYVGKSVLNEIDDVAKVHKDRVEQAGFLVLKSPEMVSILIETGFISNPKEERLLRSSKHQKKLAKAVVNGVRSYFNQYPLPGTYHAKKRAESGRYARHTIRSGDTLSTIADNYKVSVRSIRRTNSMENDVIQVGKILLIP